MQDEGTGAENDRTPPASSSAPVGLQAAAPHISENPWIRLHIMLRYPLAAMSCNSSFEDAALQSSAACHGMTCLGSQQRHGREPLPLLQRDELRKRSEKDWQYRQCTMKFACHSTIVCSSSKHPPSVITCCETKPSVSTAWVGAFEQHRNLQCEN